MVKQKSKAVEGEIVVDNDISQNRSYRQYSARPTDSALVGIWVFSVIALFFSLVPIIGLGLCVVALILCLIKKIPPVLPVLGIVIGTLTTSIFLLFWLVLKAIF